MFDLFQQTKIVILCFLFIKSIVNILFVQDGVLGKGWESFLFLI